MDLKTFTVEPWKVGAATDLNLLMLTVSAWSCFGMKIDRPGNLVVLSLTGGDFLRAEEEESFSISL